MDIQNAVYPTSERIAALAGDTAREPAVMLNLLKFRARAAYADGRASALTGREAYALYGAGMKAVVEREGGRVIFAGQARALVIGEMAALWDAVAVVEYPSTADFVRIVTLPEVMALAVHREAGLEGQILIRVAATEI
jgi:uncharacterized protein (DUF1330 family)